MSNQELADYLNRVLKNVTQLGQIVQSMAVGIIDKESGDEAYKVILTTKKKGP